MTMHYLTHRTLHSQKSMSWVWNRFRIYRIPQTWPPVTIICSQTSRDGCVVFFILILKINMIYRPTYSEITLITLLLGLVIDSEKNINHTA